MNWIGQFQTTEKAKYKNSRLENRYFSKYGN